jgi:hypothetical protein
LNIPASRCLRLEDVDVAGDVVGVVKTSSNSNSQMAIWPWAIHASMRRVVVVEEARISTTINTTTMMGMRQCEIATTSTHVVEAEAEVEASRFSNINMSSSLKHTSVSKLSQRPLHFWKAF